MGQSQSQNQSQRPGPGPEPGPEPEPETPKAEAETAGSEFLDSITKVDAETQKVRRRIAPSCQRHTTRARHALSLFTHTFTFLQVLDAANLELDQFNLPGAVEALEATAAKLKGDKSKVHGYANVLDQLGQCYMVLAGPDDKQKLKKVLSYFLVFVPTM
eukprot:SAG31_NODE_726_length_12541_cov_4.922922_2_plen_159_part_00